VLAYPGGGYSQEYFDLRPSGADGYSQAVHHAAHGVATVLLDHALPADAGCGRLLDEVARLNARVAREVLDRLRGGDVAGVSVDPAAVVVGVGQSMGAAVLTVHQAMRPTFDALALLGWSARRTALPAPPESIGPVALRSRAHFRWAYHWDDEPAPIVDADIGTEYPDRGTDCPAWGSAARPVPVDEVLEPGCVAAEAARIAVPVLLVFGERDVCADPSDEPPVYVASRRVELAVVDRVAHMHNFGPGRVQLWNRLVTFYRDVEGIAP
jgi:pimeloyl-ACP methyl ester carboxylesterase